MTRLRSASEMLTQAFGESLNMRLKYSEVLSERIHIAPSQKVSPWGWASGLVSEVLDAQHGEPSLILRTHCNTPS